MDQNTSSPSDRAASPGGLPVGPGGLPVGLEGLAAAIDGLAADDLNQLGGALLAAQVLAMRRLLDQAEADWLRRLAAADAHGAAGAERGTQALSTTGWLRATTRTSAATAAQRVRTARALHRGPLRATAAALAQGEVSYQHAAALADATSDLPPAKVAEAEPVLVDAARRLDPARLRRLAATFEGMVDVKGLLDPEAGEAVQAALAPLARPAGPDDQRSGAQRRADALGELARRALQAGDLPREGGPRPRTRRRRHRPRQRRRHPPPRHRRPPQRPGLRPRQQRRPGGRPRHRRQAGRRAARRDHPAAPTPRRAGRAAGPGPRHPRHLPSPAPRPRRPRRRLRRPRLRPAPTLDRRPPPPPLAPRRPHQPRQPGPAVPHAPPRRPRTPLAAPPRPGQRPRHPGPTRPPRPLPARRIVAATGAPTSQPAARHHYGRSRISGQRENPAEPCSGLLSYV